MICLQVEANTNIYKEGDSQSKNQFAKLISQLEIVVEHLDQTVNGKNMEGSQKTLEETTKKFNSPLNRLRKKLDKLEQYLGNKLTNVEELMKKINIRRYN